MPGISTDTLLTPTMRVHLTNYGLLGPDSRSYGITWRDSNNTPIEWTHSVWVTGSNQETLVGAGTQYVPDFTPGPIIDGEAAMIAAPEDSVQYRVYQIDSTTEPGEPDYDAWPFRWNAPCTVAGTPRIFGDATTFTVYNDAHPGNEYQGFPPTAPTQIEIHEMAWYKNAPTFSNVVFFTYHIYNRSTAPITDATFAFWSDIDVLDGGFNWGGYDHEGAYMFLYYPYDDSGEFMGEWRPRAAAYVLLQGPLVPSPGDTGRAFGDTWPDHRNLQTTGAWYIFDDRYSAQPDTLAYPPSTLEQMHYVSQGRRLTGTPIIHPMTQDTTTYLYDGDPITGDGWVWQLDQLYGGAGMIVQSSPYYFRGQDSIEVVLALVVGEGTTYAEALTDLQEQVLDVRDYWQNNHPLPIGRESQNLPLRPKLSTPYPNPFNNSTNFRVQIPNTTTINLTVFNVNGAKVKTLAKGTIEPGVYVFSWDNQNALPNSPASGVYFIRLMTPGYFTTRKVLLLK